MIAATEDRSAVADKRRSEALAKMVPSPLRTDLIIRRQLFKFEEYYVVKDPLALTYYRLTPEEAYLVSLLNGKRNLRQIANQFATRFPNSETSVEQIGAFINQLGAGGLLNVPAQMFVENARRSRSVTHNIFYVWGKIVSGFLFLKLPLIDPSPWLGRLSHALRFVWSPWFVGACLAFFAWTIGFLIAHRDAFSADVLNFLSPGNLVLLWITIILIKTCHEFGHATTCRHFGGEVHEMGVCLICFTPCGYVDASDAWMMRHNRHKIYTTIAGIFTELVIAGIAAHFWVFLPEGFARNLAFNAMLVASVNTIVFNANPLMRFDGYYVICDLFQIPNLRAKAIGYCSYYIQRLLLGYRNIQQEIAWAAEANGRMFVIYAIAAYIYMFFVIYGLTRIFARVLAPYGLHDFGLALGVFVEGSFALLPVVKVLVDAFHPGAHIVKLTSTKRRMGLTLTVVGALVAAALFLPTHYNVVQQGIVLAVNGEMVSPTIPGQVKSVAVRTGDWVQPGQLIATLENPAVQAELEARRAELAQVRLRLAQVGPSSGLAAAEARPELARMLDSAESGYARAVEDAASLELRAKVPGFVVSPAVENLVGIYLVPQQILLRIADTREVKLVIPLTEAQAQLVERGNRVEGRWRATGEPFETELSTVPTHPASTKDYTPGMLSPFGGPAPIDMARGNGNGAGRTFSLFLAEARIRSQATNPRLMEGMRARVEITGRPTTPAKKIWRWLVSLWLK